MRRLGGSEIHTLSFYSICTVPQAPSTVRAVPLSIPISCLFFDQKRMHLTKSTKDRKKGCAYDPGALKNQTLRYCIEGGGHGQEESIHNYSHTSFWYVAVAVQKITLLSKKLADVRILYVPYYLLY